MPVLPVALVIGSAPPALHMKALMLTMAGALLSGGLSLLAPFAARGPMGALCGMLGGYLLSLTLSARSPIRGDWQVRVRLTINGRTAGNRARRQAHPRAGRLGGRLPRAAARRGPRPRTPGILRLYALDIHKGG